MPSHRKNHELQSSRPEEGTTPHRFPAHPLALGGKGREVRGGSDGKIRGAALVIVLCFLVIITGLVVAFLSSVTNEATATAASAAGVTTRSLADAAIQLDIAQIRDATAGFAHDSDGSLNASPVAWASQPGAIRTFDTNASSGGSGSGGGVSLGGGALYKLYSSTNMVDTAGGNPTNDLPASGWASNPALYVDLNAPVVSQGNTNYPILDPVLTNVVDGFSINMSVPVLSGVSNTAAMPVTWLYMLKDGSLIAPDSGGTTQATFKNSSKQPTANNPIVGRIAFWTDDETCKLNINTASEGSFWGTPSFTTLMDVSMAQTPPVTCEFNRYPGHPASTSLSPVLWSFFGLSNPATFTGFLPGNPNNGYFITNTITSNTLSSSSVTNFYTNLFGNITPRYLWSGSASGVSNTLQGSNSITRSALPAVRLYSSVDELFFSATNPSGATLGRTNNPVFVMSSGGEGPGFSFVSSGVTNPTKAVAGLRFFLTAESRAPEVNPLNLPKICMWPVPDTNYTMTANPQSTAKTNTRTLADQTIAFCSTLGTNAYYFTRYDATSPTNDFSTTKTPRNVILYNYLRNQMNMPIPGFKGAFATQTPTKWNALQADQICTLLFDYIRSCINLVDSGSLDVNQMTNSLTPYQYAYTTPPTNTVTTSIQGLTTNVVLKAGTGQVIPILINNPDGNTTKGMGRFPTVRSGTLWMIARGADQPPLLVHANGRPIVFNASGTQIDNSDGTLPPAVLQGLFTNNASVYAAANPMHPWTCPPDGVTAPGTGYVTNAILTNKVVTIGGSTVTTALIPNLIRTNSGAAYPVLADLSTSNITKNLATDDATNVKALFPVFDLSCANSNIPTRTYPTLETMGSYSNGLCATIASAQLFVNSYKVGAGMGAKIYYATNYLATNVVFASNAPFTASSYVTNKPITHGGLVYLTMQQAQGASAGMFKIPNPNYKEQLTPALQPHQTRMEALFFPDLVDVAPGAVGLGPVLTVNVSGLNNFTADGGSMGFPASNALFINDASGYSGSSGASRDPNLFQVDATLAGYKLCSSDNNTTANRTPFFASSYPIVSSNTFAFGGATITLSLNSTSGSTIQQMQMIFTNATFPTPKLPPVVGSLVGALEFPPKSLFTNSGAITSSQGDLYTNVTPYIAGHGYLTFGPDQANATTELTNNPNGTIDDGIMPNAPTAILTSMLANAVHLSSQVLTETRSNSFTGPWYSAGYGVAIPYTIQSVETLYGDLRMFAALSNIPSTFLSTNPLYGQGNAKIVKGWTTYVRNASSLWGKGAPVNSSLIGTLLPSDDLASANSWAYLTSITNVTRTNVPSDPSANPIYYTTSGIDNALLPYSVPTCNFTNLTFSSIWKSGGDYDNGYGYASDGPFINKVDEGYGMYLTNITYGTYQNPYYSSYTQPSGSTLLSPNRMVPSPIIFGSLPVGFGQMGSTADPSPKILTNSWLTLQFSPNPNSPSSTLADMRRSLAGYNEAGASITNSIVPDHLLLDFFQMPVVDPYPISDSFSTAGKVNMNYQIAPFSYITRDAALRGVLKSVQITAVDETYANMYKYPGTFTNPTYTNLAGTSGNFYFNYPIQATETLRQFTNRFGSNDLFRSPSEICALWLYPAKQPTAALPNVTNALTNWDSANANIKNWWYAGPGTTRKGLTGDNIRERPYNYLYPRLTTKSNTYQIHYRVQTLKQTATAHPSDWAGWIDPVAGGITDKVIGESRGSAVIERFIDSSDTTLPDFTTFVSSGGGASVASTNTMDAYYKFRVFNAKQFTP